MDQNEQQLKDVLADIQDSIDRMGKSISKPNDVDAAPPQRSYTEIYNSLFGRNQYGEESNDVENDSTEINATFESTEIAPEPTFESIVTPVAQHITEPIVVPTFEINPEPYAEPYVEPAVELASDPIFEPDNEFIVDPLETSVPENISHTEPEPEVENNFEPQFQANLQNRQQMVPNNYFQPFSNWQPPQKTISEKIMSVLQILIILVILVVLVFMMIVLNNNGLLSLNNSANAPNSVSSTEMEPKIIDPTSPSTSKLTGNVQVDRTVPLYYGDENGYAIYFTGDAQINTISFDTDFGSKKLQGGFKIRKTDISKPTQGAVLAFGSFSKHIVVDLTEPTNASVLVIMFEGANPRISNVIVNEGSNGG